MEREELLSMNSNPLVQELGKLPEEWQREDILDIIERRGITSVRFRYPAADGRLKELKIPVANRRQIERVLANGERADGSSLFPGMIDHSFGDLYVVPIYKTAFLNPFTENALDICCRFYNRNGDPAPPTPDNTLARARERFEKKTGLELHALGEVEYYLIYADDSRLFPTRRQGGYHEASPFLKRNQVTDEILNILGRITGHVKYTHSEVGNLTGEAYTDCPELDGKQMEQHEVEFLLAPIEDMARYVLISKWVIRNVAMKYGCNVTFAPKLDEGDAGSGMHFHLACHKSGRSVMFDSGGKLSAVAKKMIAGMLDYAPSLTAFGNTVSSAYLRLVPNQEAPTRICWSESNRCAMIRVPLGWQGVENLAMHANPAQQEPVEESSDLQTVEFRVPDGSADVYLLLAGLCVALEAGLTSKDSLQTTSRLHMVGNIFKDVALAGKLQSLPASCYESAKALERDRKLYERDGVFSPQIIDFAIKRLMDQQDERLNDELQKLSNKDRLREARKIMYKFLHIM
jgi:glutamine synthetase